MLPGSPPGEVSPCGLGETSAWTGEGALESDGVGIRDQVKQVPAGKGFIEAEVAASVSSTVPGKVALCTGQLDRQQREGVTEGGRGSALKSCST